MIELTAADGQTLTAYRADPEGTPKGAVVVVQDIFGVNSNIRKIADMFAANGYVAIAPSLFDSVKPDVSLGYDDAGRDEGTALTRRSASRARSARFRPPSMPSTARARSPWSATTGAAISPTHPAID